MHRESAGVILSYLMVIIKTIKRAFVSHRNRSLALVAIHVLAYLVLGNAVILPGVPDDEWGALDQWLRSTLFVVVQPQGDTAVTYVDIDDELYRDTWGMPPVTPRDELARMLAPLATSGASMIIVDIDLAWGDDDPAMRSFLEGYAGPTPLVFVRHLEESEDGMREIVSPYDDIFESKGQLIRWAHAYFLIDADGALREWLPWVGVCGGERVRYLPSIASLVAGAVPPESNDTACPEIGTLPAYPIIYTETFSDSGAQFAAPGKAALRLPARHLLDESRIDYAAYFANRVAIVGGSHTAGLDIRQTPVGLLPGAVVQANTVLHARSQLEAANIAPWWNRLVVCLLFTLLCLVSFPISAVPIIVIAWIAVGGFSSYGIVTQIQQAVLLYVQFLLLAWLVRPFWKEARELGWRILVPEYLREEEEVSEE